MPNPLLGAVYRPGVRESSRLSRRAVLGLTAAALPLSATALPLAAAAPALAASPATAIGGERLARRGLQVEGAAAVPTKLLTARAWLVADGTTGEVLASFNAHQRLAPASTLKMLFADTVLKKFDRAEKYTVKDSDISDVPAGSSLVGIKAGITYTVEQLWQGVFLRSGNDAVHVLAHMNGGIARTVAEMQARAQDLQALDTHVVSPDGFDHPGQLSSAYDLTLFARHGLADPDFRGYCGTRVADFPAGGKKTFQIQNTDRLLTGAWGLKTYDGLIGVKNGYTSHAGNTFTGAATRDGRTLLVTVMHPATGSNAVYEQTAALLDWGFTHGRTVQPVGALVKPLSEGGAPASPAPGHAGGQAATDASAKGPSAARLVEGAAGTAALLAAAGGFLLRRRRQALTAREAAGTRRPPAPRAAEPDLQESPAPTDQPGGGRHRR
ncbi:MULTISPECIES: D-alanyl-D-alanine carboxypeptidase family protein [unclassified Streptomyces]|uniref:D-alanyl-D-alanine carboxypeptidase family protein n=1 Tax=unclassified Streptomyces TaxID=2593676 RepID=UPI0013182E2F|nr:MULTISPECIES: serine hydrolase [unclassified Streptomyces]QHC29212.1 D-alanyl-D-alanine carboxypeptidase [Streptomyces sp. HF10]WKE71982.1 serine hydrolase [Streptomyces sp. WP-1]